ncbi:MAG: pyridoxamine 5'-phosphate oxidase [Phycisphaeraceae bacterium]
MSLLSRIKCVLTMGRGVMTGLPAASAQCDPLELFGQWFVAAREAGILFPEAACLATATPDGRPSARMVLMKGYDRRGIQFFTNYDSRKARELTANPHAALCFHWAILERQVRIEGTVTRLSAQESFAYFKTRARGSRLGAWASKQSQPLASRDELAQRVKDFQAKYPDDQVPLPPYWGGFLLAPVSMEFWQGRASRLHDRLVFERTGDIWETRWLYP